MTQQVRRLYRSFHPTQYALALHPNRETMTFSGTVSITGNKVGRPSQRLTLHQKDLHILSVVVIKHDKKGDQPVNIIRTNIHASYDELRLHSGSMLYAGSYTITIAFEGTITQPMNGIYPSFFTEAGIAKSLISTQFESHHAREAFPCIDEPEAKATFDLTLTTPQDEAVVANTPIVTQQTVGTELVTTFETTPKMSTYLLAFAYGDMQYQEATTKDGVLVRTYATPDNVAHTGFALEVAVKCLEFYNQYFATPYPLPKCDLIALPDFASGAMENWGCITFREQCLLDDPENTSLATKQYVAMVIAHELAHMWFGNLVTMRWWTDLWLNEGFASWIEYLATDHNFPEWQMWTQFIVDEQQQALRLDALEHTHPIEVTINHPDEIRTIFDAISYSKGSSVIHMLEHYLGADTFRDGLRLYLNRHAYGNTDTVDLWAAFEEVSGKPVTDFMTAWTSQPGFPIVTATTESTKLHVAQERFYVNPAAQKNVTIWPIPLLPSQSLSTDILTTATANVDSSAVLPTFVLNSDRSGLYRTVYDSTHLAQLAQEVTRGQLGVVERLGILSDTIEAAKAGYSSTVDALKLLENYRQEDNNVVWDIIAGMISSIRTVMRDDKLRESMKPYIRKLVQPQLTRLGWDERANDSYFDKLLRPLVIGMAAGADDESIVTESLARFNKAQSPTDIAPDLRGILYGTAARKGDAKTFNRLLKFHNESTSSEDRVTLSAALTSFEQPELIDQALNLITTDAVRLQDASYWVAYSFMNRFARDSTWEWMVEHWDWLFKHLGTDLSFYRMPIYAARCYSDASFIPIFTKFFASVMRPALDRPIQQGIETITWQSAWRQRDFDTVSAFFNQ
jgi:aminopeptidase N